MDVRKYGLQVVADYTDVAADDLVREKMVVHEDRTLVLKGNMEVHVVVERDAKLTVRCEGVTLAMLRVAVAAGVSFVLEHQGAAEDVTRLERVVHLAEGASFTDLSAVEVKGRFDMLTKAVHEGAQSASRLLSKIVVHGGGKAIARGVIEVQKQARGSQGFERIDALLLDSTAKADVLPMLKVDTDDVACKHAATVGAVDDEHLFYLMSRGMTEMQAKQLVVEGFLSDVCVYGRA